MLEGSSSSAFSSEVHSGSVKKFCSTGPVEWRSDLDGEEGREVVEEAAISVGKARSVSRTSNYTVQAVHFVPASEICHFLGEE